MNHMRFSPKIIGLALGLLLLVACGTSQTAPTPTPTPVPLTPTSVPPADTPTPAAMELGQIMGVLVDKETGKSILDRPALFRDLMDGDDEAEIQEYMNKIELETDGKGGFHFTGVPPGKYNLFTTKHGIVTTATVTLLPGETVDLGEIKIAK